MVFFLRSRITPAALAILPGAFNPLTRAHMAMAEAALAHADEVLFILPRIFPHKSYDIGASFDERLSHLREAARDQRYSIATTDRGLFIDIAAECRDYYPKDTRLLFVCGRDAAERIVNWDYGRPGAIEEQLREYELLVASREGDYIPPEALRSRVHALDIPVDCQKMSSTEVRKRMATGEPWRHLVP
ncbi:MAG: hypothetical protein ABIZ80_18715 [Bryobacteraceae bacterium]